MMLALIRKDLRLLTTLLATSGVLYVLLCVVLPVARFETETFHPTSHGNITPSSPALALTWRATESAMFLLPCSWIGCAVVAGMAFTVERRERWAEFLAVLPVSRRRVVAGKLLVFGGVCAGSAALTLAIVLGLGAFSTWYQSPDTWTTATFLRTADWNAVGSFVAAGTALFGLAWLLSSLLRSAPLAAVIAIAVIAAGYFSIFEHNEMTRFDRPAQALRDWRANARDVAARQTRTAIVFGSLGLACVAAGTVVQTKRTTP